MSFPMVVCAHCKQRLFIWNPVPLETATCLECRKGIHPHCSGKG